MKVYDNFQDGQLWNELASKIGTIEFKGFHTIDLEEPVKLDQNDNFFIYLKFSDHRRYDDP